MAPRAHATFALRQAENGFFYLHWKEGSRNRRRSTHTKELVQAKAFLSSWLVSGTAHGVIRRGPTCAQLWALYWRDHVERKVVDASTHRIAWRALEPRFGKLTPSEVTRETIQEHIAARHTAKPTSLFSEFRLLTASWSYGVKRRVLASSDVPPLDDLDLPNEPPPRTRWLRTDEVERLFAAGARIRARRGQTRLLRIERFMWLALETAGRRTALLELKWDQIDFESRILHLNPEGRVQTKKRRASVPISDALLLVLQRAHQEKISDYVLDHPSRLHDALNAVAAEAEVEGVTAHVFRHTAATWMARKGVPLFHIAKVLGNTVEEVEYTYAKYCVDDLRDAVNLLGGSLSISLGLEN